jgi:hypothetical protein
MDEAAPEYVFKKGKYRSCIARHLFLSRKKPLAGADPQKPFERIKTAVQLTTKVEGCINEYLYRLRTVYKARW